MGRGLLALPSRSSCMRLSPARTLNCSIQSTPCLRIARPARSIKVLAAKQDAPSASPVKIAKVSPTSAKDAVERGLVAFKDGRDYDEAVRP